MINVLAIGDPHTSAEDNELERFAKVGRHIVDTKPDAVVLMGDFLTLDCLSAWDRNKRLKMEGRRYKDEVAVGNTALDILFSDLARYNNKRRKNKKKLYTPEVFYLEGNHEERLTRYLENDPTFLGLADVRSNLNIDERGFTWVPYREYLDIDGVKFTHIPHNTMKPIASAGLVTSVAKKALQYCDFDVVFGHTHKLEVAHATRASGVRHTAINVGNFASSQGEEYMEGKVSDWWTGIVDMTIDNGSIQNFTATPKEYI